MVGSLSVFFVVLVPGPTLFNSKLQLNRVGLGTRIILRLISLQTYKTDISTIATQTLNVSEKIHNYVQGISLPPLLHTIS